MGFQWTPDLKVGVHSIDQRHKEIFRRVDALVEATSKGGGRERLAELLPFLGSYVEHFGDEERAMRSAGYPDFARHAQLHAAFRADVAALRKRFEMEGASTALTLAVQKRLVEWLVHHVKREDKIAAAFLKQKTAALA